MMAAAEAGAGEGVVEAHRVMPGELGDELALGAAGDVRAAERGGAVEMLRRDGGRGGGGRRGCRFRPRVSRHSPLALGPPSLIPNRLARALPPLFAQLPPPPPEPRR